MISNPKALIVPVFFILAVASPWDVGVATASAQTVSVTAANPSSGQQGTLNLNVIITGKGFKSGARANFYRTGTNDSAGVTVKATRYVTSTELVANIDIADVAALSAFDIQVANTDGRTGKGTELFKVVVKRPTEPVTVWSVVFEDPDGTSPVFGSGELAHGSPVMVIVQYNTPVDSPAYSRFFVEVGRGYTNWLGFRGLELQSSTLEPGLTPTCRYPSFDLDGRAILTGGYAPNWDGCALEFLSGVSPIGHKHPDGAFYTWASMEFRGEFQFDAMEVGASMTVTEGVALSPSILTAPCETTYAGVRSTHDADPDASLVVTRTGANTWVIEATGRLTVQEYGPPTVFKKAPKGGVTCSGNEWGRTVVTQPIRVVSTWRRQ